MYAFRNEEDFIKIGLDPSQISYMYADDTRMKKKDDGSLYEHYILFSRVGGMGHAQAIAPLDNVGFIPDLGDHIDLQAIIKGNAEALESGYLHALGIS